MSHEVYFIDISVIDHNPFQPRGAIDPVALQELAQDIYSKREMLPDTAGLMQPPIVRHNPVDEERYQLLFGHRRLEAFRLLAQTTPIYAWLPCLIEDVSNEEMIAVAWAENSQRQDLTIIEEAEYVVHLMDDFGWTLKSTAELLGIAHGTLSNTVRLAKLPVDVKARLQAARVSRAICMELLRLPSFDTPEAQALLAEVTSMRWTQVKQRVDNIVAVRDGYNRQDPKSFDDLVAPAAQALADALAEGDQGAWLLLLRRLMKIGESDIEDIDDARLAVAERVLRTGIRRVNDTRSVKRALVDMLEDADVESPWNRAAMVKADQFLRWRMDKVGQNGRSR